MTAPTALAPSSWSMAASRNSPTNPDEFPIFHPPPQTKKENIMSTLYHSVPVDAPPEKVFAAVATQAGMQGWWTKDTKMTPKVGGKGEFGFANRGMVCRMTIEELVPNKSIKMSCSGDHPDWTGTTLEWVVTPGEEGS